MEHKFRNKITLDVRILTDCQKKIDKTRFYKLFKMLSQSISADNLHPESMDEHDKYFEPRTEAEKDLWHSCRDLAKNDMINFIKSTNGGKKSAEIRRQKATAQPKPSQPVTQEPDLPPITMKKKKEDFMAWASQMNDFAGTVGFKNTSEQAETFWNHFEAQGWRRKNGMPIINIEALFKVWVDSDKKKKEQEDDIPTAPKYI